MIEATARPAAWLFQLRHAFGGVDLRLPALRTVQHVRFHLRLLLRLALFLPGSSRRPKRHDERDGDDVCNYLKVAALRVTPVHVDPKALLEPCDLSAKDACEAYRIEVKGSNDAAYQMSAFRCCFRHVWKKFLTEKPILAD